MLEVIERPPELAAILEAIRGDSREKVVSFAEDGSPHDSLTIEFSASKLNRFAMVCRVCSTSVIGAGITKLEHCPTTFSTQAGESIELSYFWRVPAFHSFDNVGVTHSHEGRKYLCCGECEREFIGFVHADGRIYLSVSRINY